MHTNAFVLCAISLVKLVPDDPCKINLILFVLNDHRYSPVSNSSVGHHYMRVKHVERTMFE